jgi:hypothetical protein
MLENVNNSNFYTGCIDGEIRTYCSQVKCGSKPIAFITVKTVYEDIVTNYIKEHYNLNVYIQDIENYTEWKTLFVYKHDYLIDIINSLPEEPQTPYEHWIVGKACGYSDDAIGEFIKSKL